MNDFVASIKKTFKERMSSTYWFSYVLLLVVFYWRVIFSLAHFDKDDSRVDKIKIIEDLIEAMLWWKHPLVILAWAFILMLIYLLSDIIAKWTYNKVSDRLNLLKKTEASKLNEIIEELFDSLCSLMPTKTSSNNNHIEIAKQKLKKVNEGLEVKEGNYQKGQDVLIDYFEASNLISRGVRNILSKPGNSTQFSYVWSLTHLGQKMLQYLESKKVH